MTTTLIKGGKIFDVESGTSTSGDVLIRDGKIAALGLVETEDADIDEQIDASDACVAPGFIDLHTHVFSHPLFQHSRLQADRIGVTQGVACVIDAGSSGPATIDAFPEFVHKTQETRVYAFVNVGSPGLPNLGGGHSSRPELVSLSGAVESAERHSDWIVGIKVLASASHTGMFGIEAVKIGRKAADLTGMPLMCHIGNAPPVIDEVLDMLAPGDIVTHSYHGKIGGVLGRNKKVLPAFKRAVERGVIVDLAHGRSSFSFATCEAALDQGMPVHCVSSDLHLGNVDRYVVSLARTMTKMRMLGLTLHDVVKAVTLTPAKAIGIDQDGFGALKVDGPAHITLFREVADPITMEDAEGEERSSETQIVPHIVFVNGQRYDTSSPL